MIIKARNDECPLLVGPRSRAIASGTAATREEWRAIPGYEGFYEVSTFGRVRGVDRILRFVTGGKLIKRKQPGRIIGQSSKSSDGYSRVLLRRDGTQKMIVVHRLVARTFLADKRNVLHNEVAHLDGTRTNARVDNLKWVSKVENRSHRKLHGTECRGQAHGAAKLTNSQAAEIRRLRGRVTCSNLARRFGVSRWTIESIIYGKSYRIPEAGFAGPSREFVSLTRNPDLAETPPWRFEPTTKAEGDIIL